MRVFMMAAAALLSVSVAGIAHAEDPKAPTAQTQATTPAPAAAPAAPAAPAAAKKNDQDRVVCRTSEDTGSRVSSRRICHTVREWQEISRDSQDFLNDAQKNHQLNPQG